MPGSPVNSPRWPARPICGEQPPGGGEAGVPVDLEGVSVAFGSVAVLRAVSCRVEAGEQVAIVGSSGAGKTTFLKLLNATVRPDRGSVSLGGVDLSGLRGKALRWARAQVGFVHQDHALVPNLRVVNNIAAGRLGRCGFLGGMRNMLWPKREDLVRMHRLLNRIGIEEKLFQRTDSLSGGQQQRVAIARALWQEPTLLLADEPVASVDPARARDVIRLLCEVAEERGLTLVVSLHDLSLAREFFPRLVGLRGGEIVIDAPPNAVDQDAFQELYRFDTDSASGAPEAPPSGGERSPGQYEGSSL